MDDSDSKKLEQEFSERNETLASFYESSSLELTNEELTSLTPILNSLKDDAQRYREIEKIAEGGEKKITLVHDYRLDRRIAMARAVRNENPQDLEQFLREARLTANLAHPNIMPVYNMGLDEVEEPFFSMELVPGDSLKAIVRKLREGDEAYRKNFPLETLLNIFLKICDAIAYAHSRRVLHLDIKPDNIRVGEFGEVFVCDWGLARVLNAEVQADGEDSELLDGDVLNDMTLSGTMKGTPGFMAPEQTEAYREKNERTDVYALGALLYVLLTYKLPVEGKTANQVISNTREGNVIPMRRRKPDVRVPRSLSAVTLKALSLKPEDRYKSVMDFRQDISRFLTGHPTHAERAGVITRTSLLLKRHNRIAFLLISFLVLLAFIISAYLAEVSREKEQSEYARRQAEAAWQQAETARLQEETARQQAETARKQAESARNQAEESREKAVAERKKAEQNFTLYKREQKVTAIQAQQLEEAVSYTVRSRDYVHAPSMIRLLERGLSESKDAKKRKYLYEQKGILHFVLQQFNMANACFNETGKTRRVGQLRDLSKKYAQIKLNDDKHLTDQQLADLFNEANTANRMTLYYLYYHHMRGRPSDASAQDYLPLAGAVLDKLNYSDYALTNPLTLDVREDGNYMDLVDVPYSVFSINIIGVYRRNVLAPLLITHLDVSHTGLDNLDELRGMQLRFLRMAGLPIEDRSPSFVKQAKILGLKRIAITFDDFPPETIDALKQEMTVVDVDAQRKAEAKRRREEEARKKAEEEQRQKEAAEKRRKAEEARKKREAAALKQRQEQEARKKAEEAAKRKAQKEAAKKAQPAVEDGKVPPPPKTPAGKNEKESTPTSSADV